MADHGISIRGDDRDEHHGLRVETFCPAEIILRSSELVSAWVLRLCCGAEFLVVIDWALDASRGDWNLDAVNVSADFCQHSQTKTRLVYGFCQCDR